MFLAVNRDNYLDVSASQAAKLFGCHFLVSLHCSLSKPGSNIIFYNEIESVRRCAQELKTRKINKIIALGHSGIDVDKMIAQNVEEIDIVVGGHSNTFLYTGRRGF